jgi:predicted pyridoxine 5'-phosphate oxidase superfamily flavin-nucleotide-binding protein
VGGTRSRVTALFEHGAGRGEPAGEPRPGAAGRIVAVRDHLVTSLQEIRELYGEPGEGVLLRELDHLDGHCRALIAYSPFVVVSTASAAGQCDPSPKGGAPGSVTVLDDRRLAFADARGNRRLAFADARGNRRVDSLHNLLENPHVGMLFLIPGNGETLRVNGTAQLSLDPGLLSRLTTGGQPARLAVVVTVEQAYMHCARAILRSRLWSADAWSPGEALPSGAEIMADHTGVGDRASWETAIANSYTNRL